MTDNNASLSHIDTEILKLHFEDALGSFTHWSDEFVNCQESSEELLDIAENIGFWAMRCAKLRKEIYSRTQIKQS